MFRWLFPSLLFLILFACKNSRIDEKVPEVKIPEIKFLPLHKDLFSIDTNRLAQETSRMQKIYGSFYNRYVTSIVNNGGLTDITYAESLKRFVGDSTMRDVARSCDSVFTPDRITDLQEDLTEAFRRIKSFVPDSFIPEQFVGMMTGFQYHIVNIDSTLGAGLEFYLGKNAVYYSLLQPPIPEYKKRIMTPDYLVRDMVYGWIRFKFDNNQPASNLLQVMLHEGKMMYLTKAAIPDMEDSVLLGYTGNQMEYCERFEKDLWRYFSEKNRLYVNDMKELMAYTSDGPFTAAISKECPPFIAGYVGYKIIYSYMETNPEVTFAAMMADKDFQRILSKAKYKPD